MNSTDPAPRPSSLAPWLKRLAIALALIAGLYLAVVFAASRLLDPVRVADWIQPRVSAAVNRDVTIEAADVRLFPFEVRLSGLQVSDPTGLASSLARIDRLGLRVALLPLLRRRVMIDRVDLVGVVANLRVGADGVSNFGDMSTDGSASPAEGESSEEALELDLRTLRLEDGRVSFEDGRDSTSMVVDDLEATAAIRASADGTWSARGDARAVAAVRIATASRGTGSRPVDVTFDLTTGPRFGWIEIGTGEIRLDGVPLSVQGSIRDLEEPVRTVSLRATVEALPAERLVDLLPDSVVGDLGVEGLLDGAATVEGEFGPDVRPEVVGRMSLSGGGVVFRGRSVATALEAQVELNPDGTLSPRVEGTVLGGPARVEGRVRPGDGGEADLTLRAEPDLAAVGPLEVLPEGVAVDGRLVVDARARWPLSAPRRLRIDGDVVLDAVNVRHPGVGVPVQLAEGRVRLAGEDASWSDLVVRLGTDRLVTTGSARGVGAFTDPDDTPFVEGIVSSSHLDARTLRTGPLPDTALTYGRIAFARLGGREVQGRSVEEAAEALALSRPVKLPVSGILDVALDTLVDRRGAMEDVRARVEFGPDFVNVRDATFLRYGGRIRTDARLSLGEGAEQPFSFRFSTERVDAGALLGATTSLGSAIQGSITVDLDVSGALDQRLLPTLRSLVGTGGFRLEGGAIRSTPLTRELAAFLGREGLVEPRIDSWATGFVLEDGRVRLREARVDGVPGSPRVGGGIGLDGGLDLRSAFTLPAQGMDSVTLARLGVAGDVLGRVMERDDVVEAIVRIGGSLTSPQLVADPAAAAATVTDAVREEAMREAQERVQEQRQQLEERAGGFIRGLLGRSRQTTSDTVNADPAPAQDTPTDTVAPDTIPPDTVPPVDASPADSLAPDTTVNRPARRGA